MFSVSILAQDSTTIFVPAGSSFADVASARQVYKLPQFKTGSVHFKDGSMSSAKLNYNLVNGQVEFINPKGDTLAIIREQAVLVKYIAVDSSTFYYFDSGYLEEMAANETGKLLKCQWYRLRNREKIGAYNLPSSTSAIDSYATFTSGAPGALTQKLVVRENLTLAKATEYYFGDKYNNFLRANKKNLLRLYAKKKTQIETYLQQNHVDFNKADDLQKLLAFLGQ